jgi:branched-chain amino acid transport system substrate-binding protein
MAWDGVIGAQLAAADINAAGGINGRHLELVVVEENHATLPQDAIATADRLAADSRVLAVIGHHGSSESLAASQVYNARHIAQIAPNSSAPLYTQAGPYSFRLVASDVHQAEFIAARIAAMSPVPRIAMLYVNDDYGRALRGFVQAALRGAGTPAVYEAPFVEGEALFTASRDDILRSLKNARPDLLLWIGRAEELVLLRSRLRQELPDARVLGSDAALEGNTFPVVPAFAGDLMVSYVDITAPRPDLRNVASRFEAATGQPLTDAAALTYDAVGVVVAAMRAGASDREGIRRYLGSLALPGRVYSGITGEISLDANGDARPSYVLFEITVGGLRLVGR